ncbi:MAG: oligosaccharide flippase family protein [Clostridia bacterium]|nr:oligosaccharide flippase family protein [Clostridia bacterium]
MKTLKIFVFNTLILLFSSVILQIIGMFFNIYISRTIGEEAIGVFSLVLSVYAFGITLASAGINISTTRVVSEELACNNEIGAKKAAQRCIFFSIIFGVCASIIFFLLADFITINCLHNKISKKVIYLICIALPFISMSSAINGYFTGVRRVYKNAFAKFFEEFIKIACTAILLKSFMPDGINYACYALVLADVISEILSFIYLYILYKIDKRRSLLGSRYKDLDSYNKRILRIAIPVALTSYLRSGLSTVKQLIIPSSLQKSGMNSSNSLISYGIVNGMAMPIIMFPVILVTSFSSLLVPEYSRYLVEKKYKKITSISTIILVGTLVFSILVTLFIMIFADKLSLIIYNKLEIAKYLRILSPLIIIMYLDIVIDSILKGLDYQVDVMAINIFDCIVSIAFIYFLVPILGFNGYIISIFISEVIDFTFSGYKLLTILKKFKEE